MLISPAEGIRSSTKHRITTVLQNESSECGLACLTMIANAFGNHVTLSQLRRRFLLSSKGLELRSLIDIADKLDLSARPVKADLHEITNLSTPAILHWNLNHFVVLEKVKGSKILIHDPARGARWIDPAEANSAFTGVAVEFSTSPKFTRARRTERVEFRDLFGRVRGLVPSLVQIFILASVAQIFSLAMPIISQLIIDESINKGNGDLLSVLTLAMMILVIVVAGVRLLQGNVALYMGTQMSFQMRSNVLRHTLRLPVSWFEKRHVGDVVSRFSSLQAVQDFVVSSVPSSILSLVIGIAAIIMMIIYSPLLSFIIVFCSLISMAVRLSFFPVVRRLTRDSLHQDAKVQTVFLETIRGARTFKLFNHERERVLQWQNEQARLINSQVALARIGLGGNAAISILSGAQQALIWYVGARQVIDGGLSLGMLFAFQAYSAQFTGAANVLSTQLFALRTANVHLERLADVIHAEEETGEDNLPIGGGPIRGEVELRNVSFRYGDHEPYVLRDINLHIRPGDFVCLEGPSGHGKTTLLKLILGFDEPQSGEILIDRVPLRRAGLARYRDQIGVVLQDDQLMAGTLADNIAFFSNDSRHEDIEVAARAAGIHDEIMRMPMGYLTFVGDLGSSLSGGQRQRVLLARALYRRPRILFLDEGTANLDAASEEFVMRTIDSLDATRIVVAHRRNAGAGASRRFSVANGAVSEIAAQ